MTYDLAIDLGTTWTAAALRRGDRRDIVQLGNRAAVIPSVLYLAADGSTLAGESAQRRGASDPGRFAAEFKRRFGDPTPSLVGGTPMSAEALQGRLARWVLDRVAEREAAPPARVALTHPATWGPYKLDALRNAARQAGILAEPALVPEPVAAALHHATTERVPEGAHLAVYDLGGGTFDATVLHRDADGGFSIVGTPEGLERLGGIDIDEAVLGFVREALGAELARLDAADPAVLAALARLRDECVAAKEALSTETETSVPVLLPGTTAEVRLTRRELEQRVRPALLDTVEAMRRALAGAGVTQPHAVLLVGGASRMPLVAELVAEGVGAPVALDVHPKHAVALGALLAIDGGATSTAAGPAVAAPAPSPVQPAAAAPPDAPEVPPPPVVAPPPAPAPSPAPPAPASPAPAEPAAPAAASRSRVPILAAAAAVVVILGLGGALLLGGGDGGGAGANDAVGCKDAGPFICITDVSVAGGALVANFEPVDVDLVPVGQETSASDLHAQFFLATLPADEISTTSPAGAPDWVDWGSARPFEGFSPAQWERTTALCAVLATPDQVPLAGSGNCRPLPR